MTPTADPSLLLPGPLPEQFRELGRRVNPRSGTPIYRQLSTLLRQWIEEGRLQPGDRLPPERELQQLFGVSRSTLRAALEPLISEELLEATQGRGSFVREPKLVREPRLLVPEPFGANHWLVSPVHYDWINAAAKAAKAQVLYHYTPDVEALRAVLEEPPEGCEGLLLFRPGPPWSQALHAFPDAIFAKCPVPVMLAGRPLHKKGLHVVTCDYAAATQAVVKRLAALGHRKIGFIGAEPVPGHSFEAFHTGFCAGMKEARLPVADERVLLLGGEVLIGGVSPEEVVTQMREFVERRTCTAVVVALLVQPFELAIQRSGVVLPEELSVMVVSEEHVLESAIRWSALAEPSASVVHAAVQHLSDLCRGRTAVPPYEIIPFSELPGGTCKPWTDDA